MHGLVMTMTHGMMVGWMQGGDMKAYGHSRRDKLECRWGCCTGKSGSKKWCRYVVDKAKRKAARQQAKKVAHEGPS